jgi:hypothetical protein
MTRSDRRGLGDGQHTIEGSAGNTRAFKQLQRLLSAQLEAIGSRHNLAVTC